jgi:predicted metal-dependent HD superfamily phosphohydrolase
MVVDESLVEDCILYATNLIDKLNEDFYYHNTQHTLLVIEVAKKLAIEEGLTEKEQMLLSIAAAFHDTGFTRETMNHEAAGVWIMGDYLRYRVKPADLLVIEHLILATDVAALPLNKLEKVIKDADLSYLGTKTFIEKSNLLRKEWQAIRKLTFNDNDWLKMNLRFLKENEFHTDSAKRIFEKVKEQNLKEIELRINS